jgi:hypothetical protein
LMVTGKIPEPQTRIAGKRLFTVQDVERLGHHFRVRPNWSALDPVSAESPADSPSQLTLRGPYDVHQVGETGHEVRDGDGDVFAWASDRSRALMIAGLLEAAARG